MPRKWTRRFLLTALMAGSLGGGGWLFTRGSRFGALPEGEELERCLQSRWYYHGAFHNIVPTPLMRENRNMFSAWVDYLLAKKERVRPSEPLPTVKTNLAALDIARDTLIWLGHSFFYMHLDGQRILLDPVCSEYAAPLPVTVKAFPGTTLYTPEEFPPIDILLLSHDHWDHLDYPTLHALEPHIRRVVCGLGMGAHLTRFGFPKEKISEGDWGDSIPCGSVTIHVTSARHYSGRLLSRNKVLWVGFLLNSAKRRVFFSGDSGYGPHFTEIGRCFGAPDLALLDMGQYNERWPLVHMVPEEAARAADDLGARALLPTHVGRFSISLHAWDEPYQRIARASEGRTWRLLTPRMGEPVFLDAPAIFPSWWEEAG